MAMVSTQTPYTPPNIIKTLLNPNNSCLCTLLNLTAPHKTLSGRFHTHMVMGSCAWAGMSHVPDISKR